MTYVTFYSVQQTTSLRRLSASDMSTAASDPNASDNLSEHVVEYQPKDNEVGVALGTSIAVTFDRDVRKVNINKLFEVRRRGGEGLWSETLFAGADNSPL